MFTINKTLLVPEEYSPTGFRICHILPSGNLCSPVIRTVWKKRIMKAHKWNDSGGIHAIRLPKKLEKLSPYPSTYIMPGDDDSAVVVVKPTVGSSVVTSKYAFKSSEVAVQEIILRPEMKSTKTEKKVRKVWEPQGVKVSCASEDCQSWMDYTGAIKIEKTYFGVSFMIDRLSNGEVVILVILQPTLHDVVYKKEHIMPIPGTRMHNSLRGYVFAKPRLPNHFTLLQDIHGHDHPPIEDRIRTHSNNPIIITRRIRRTINQDIVDKIRSGNDSYFRNTVMMEVKPLGLVKVTFGTIACNAFEVLRVFAPNRNFEAFETTISLHEIKHFWESRGVEVLTL